MRTTERIPVGSTFYGTLNVVDSIVDDRTVTDTVVRLALLSIGAIGGNRNRGGGLCVVEIKEHNETPGTLFQELIKINSNTSAAAKHNNLDTTDTTPITLRLLFTGDSPMCCPEHPVPSNVIKSGFVIPASAVQGLIVSRLNAVDENAATQLFKDENFRAYPLLPCAAVKRDDPKYPVPLRVSLTHKVAKLITDDGMLDGKNVADEAIEPSYDWTKIDGANPLKATGGVLLVGGDTSPQLWKAGSIPHVVSAYGVLNDPQTNDGRNLYQVDSIAPLVWSGFVCLPKYAADFLINNLNGQTVFFGKKRSTHGSGKLSVMPVNEDDNTLPWNNTLKDKSVLIVQSPILIGQQSSELTADKEFAEFIKKEWNIDVVDRKGTAIIGIQFGWNRHCEDNVKLTGKGKRIKAQRCVMPGSVIVLPENVDVKSKIKKGLGSGREQGFGAVAYHPGKATKIYDGGKPELKYVKSDADEKAMLTEALDIWRKYKNDLPSPSQLSAVRSELLAGGKERAKQYLQHQTERTERIWATWEGRVDKFKSFIEKFDKRPDKGLKLIIDLRIAEKKDK